MISRTALPWQLILADLSLILFMVALAGLAGTDAPHKSTLKRAGDAAIAQAQALFRPSQNGSDWGEWLDMQDSDPRATLTIFARHAPSQRQAIWREASTMAEIAQAKGYSVRVIITPGTSRDIYASLAFDGQQQREATLAAD